MTATYTFDVFPASTASAPPEMGYLASLRTPS